MSETDRQTRRHDQTKQRHVNSSVMRMTTTAVFLLDDGRVSATVAAAGANTAAVSASAVAAVAVRHNSPPSAALTDHKPTDLTATSTDRSVPSIRCFGTAATAKYKSPLAYTTRTTARNGNDRDRMRTESNTTPAAAAALTAARMDRASNIGAFAVVVAMIRRRNPVRLVHVGGCADVLHVRTHVAQFQSSDAAIRHDDHDLAHDRDRIRNQLVETLLDEAITGCTL